MSDIVQQDNCMFFFSQRNHAMEEAFCPTVDHSSPLMVFNKQVNVTKVKNLCVKLAEVNHYFICMNMLIECRCVIWSQN